METEKCKYRVITLRVNDEVMNIIKQAAAVRSMTVAGYVKSVLAEEVRKNEK